MFIFLCNEFYDFICQGLENETRTKERLEASLREIERFQARHFVDFCQDVRKYHVCRYKEEASCFFFLSLLSEMSGWIPTSDELLPEVASRFGCIQGMSMQEIEIVSAVYRDRNPNGKPWHSFHSTVRGGNQLSSIFEMLCLLYV